MPLDLPDGVAVHHATAPVPPSAERVLTPDALAFVASLERTFRERRRDLLAQRRVRQRDLDAGAMPGLLVETRAVRDGEWTVAPTPPALERRRVEITGPVDRKMMINALNSGADAFMADFEDALAPTWENVVEGQANVQGAVRGTLAFTGPDGRGYALDARTATLMLRPRGWHLDEAHVTVDGAPVSASLFDFGLALFHNAAEQLTRGVGPYFYLPKLEGHREARLWNDVFVAAQEALGIPRGSVRATVLVETILAAFEMDEILYELREHAAGLNAGRWDYIFSIIKKFSGRADMVLPDRAQITMTVPFMRAYTDQLVRVCHRRGAHAIGGMAAFVPNRRDAAVTESAIARVRADKEREAGDGFDGTWVAHPDLVPVAMEVFAARLGERPHQKDRSRDDVRIDAGALTRLDVPNGRVTDDGLRANVDVALRYLDAWLRGAGAVAIHNLMEDAATAEIARAQLWQWVRHGTRTDDGDPITADRYERVRTAAVAAIAAEQGAAPTRLAEAATLLDRLVLAPQFVEFLTVPAYALLEASDSASDDGADEGATAVTAERATDADRLDGLTESDYARARRGAERLRELLAAPGVVAAARIAGEADAVHAVRAGARVLDVQRIPWEDATVAARVRRAADALTRARRAEGTDAGGEAVNWLVPLIAEVAPDDDPAHVFGVVEACIAAGAAAVRLTDRGVEAAGSEVAARVIAGMHAARLAAAPTGVPLVVIAAVTPASAARAAAYVRHADTVAYERSTEETATLPPHGRLALEADPERVRHAERVRRQSRAIAS